MRVLMATTGGDGHFRPLLPFARACIDAGHEVLVAAPASFEPVVTETGLACHPVGDPSAAELGAVFGGLSGLSLEAANAAVVRDVFCGAGARAALPAMRELASQWRPDVIVRESAEFASYAVASACGIAQVHVAIGLETFDAFVYPLVDDRLAELGAGDGVAGLFATPRVSLAPASLESTTDTAVSTTARFRRNGDQQPAATLPPGWWPDAEAPLVYMTFGSTQGASQLFPDLYRAAAVAVAELPVRVLLTVGRSNDPAALGALPPNVHVERWWPQQQVMPHTAVMVGHGGWGTTLDALAAGIPMVVLPLFALDQHHNARAVEAVGAGVALWGGAADIPQLPEAVDRAMRPACRVAATAIQTDMEALPPASRFPTTLPDLIDAGPRQS